MPQAVSLDADVLLCAVSGPADGICWGVEGRVVLGRDAEISVDDPLLSREHLQVRQRSGRVWVRDLRSTNGTLLRHGPLRVRVGERWLRWRPGARLRAGNTELVVRRRPVAGVRVRTDSSRVARLAIPGAMLAAMVPFALAGPAWRWVLVAAPLAALVATLARSDARGHPIRPEHPHHLFVASGEGRSFHAGTVLPRRPRALSRADLAGSGWAFLGTGARASAVWLAGMLAVANDPSVLRVTSPWITTAGTGMEVRFEESPRSGPRTDQCLVTWSGHRAPAWAAVLQAPSWAHAGEAWAERLGVAGAAGALPRACNLEDVLDTRTAAVERGWRRGTPQLAVPVGIGERGPHLIDLVAGPHALVAGTTGSGKSEFLTTWLLAMALRNSPELLQYVLVDFKGGAAFHQFQGLPHCAGVLTDLDPALTRRALASLKAQLRARERQFAEAGVRDIGEFNRGAAAPLPILVVVVDEYRALAAENPHLLDQFLHLAGMGRSLGLHLVAATQRPGGAVGPELRANMGLRVCLRVAEAADSHDVLGQPAAALLERIPGRAVIAAEETATIQVAWSGDRPRVAARVAALRALWDGAPMPRPWTDPLPGRIPADALPAGVIGVADVPEELRHEGVRAPASGVLVLGVAGSGKSWLSRLLAQAAVAEGRQAWLVTASAPSLLAPALAPGTEVHPRQVRLVRHLFAHVVRPGGEPATLLIDGVEALVEAWDSVHGPGSASAALASLIRTARGAGARVVVTGEPGTGPARWAGGLTTRIHLSGMDATTALLAGVGRDDAALLAGTRQPGRGLLGGRLVQFAEPGRATPPDSAPPARRFLPLPDDVVAPARADGVFLGCGGTEPRPVLLPPAVDVVVLGPAGSGRGRAASAIAAQLDGAVLVPGTPLPTGAPEDRPPLVAVWDHAQWCSAAVGPAAQLRSRAALLVLRPDLLPALPGLDLGAELEPGSPGYAILVFGGRATALRVPQSVRNPEER